MLEEKERNQSIPVDHPEADVTPPSGNTPQATTPYVVENVHGPQSPKSRPQYLKIRCPAGACKNELVLACPYCQTGVLTCQDHHFVLSCKNCHNSLRSVTCNCGFCIRASYIADKERKLRQLRQAADPEAYRSIFTLFAICGGLLLLTSVIGT